MAFGHGVGLLDARGAVGAAARVQPVDGAAYGVRLRGGGRAQRHARVPRIGHDADAVARVEFAQQGVHARLDQRQFVRLVHRPGHVEQEDQVHRGALLLAYVFALQRDAREPVLRGPRTRRHIGIHGKRGITLRHGIAIVEVIDQFLDAHRVGRGTPPTLEETPRIRVARGVDIDAERR